MTCKKACDWRARQTKTDKWIYFLVVNLAFFARIDKFVDRLFQFEKNLFIAMNEMNFIKMKWMIELIEKIVLDSKTVHKEDNNLISGVLIKSK